MTTNHPLFTSMTPADPATRCICPNIVTGEGRTPANTDRKCPKHGRYFGTRFAR